MSIYNIITPSTRIHRLRAVYDSILQQKVPLDQITWWIVYDALKIYPNVTKGFTRVRVEEHALLSRAWGYAQTDLAINQIESGWVYRVDDDNIVHPNFLEALANFEKQVLVVDQIRRDGSYRLRAAPENLHGGAVDTAQFAVQRDVIGDVRWADWGAGPEGDGYFVSEIYKANQDAFAFVNAPLCYYNYQR